MAGNIGMTPIGGTALVAGSSGLVGRQLLAQLLAAPEYTRVHALSRRPLSLEHPRLANRIVRFDTLEAQLAGFTCQDAFCCLGTTLRQAGSEEAFRAVDLDLVLRFAHAAQVAGAQRLVVVSAVSASVNARNFYLRVKGETERALENLGFRSLDLMQPALLLGSRRERRVLESCAQIVMPVVNPLLMGQWSRWRAMSVAALAAAMLGAARSGRKGVYRYVHDDLIQLAIASRRHGVRL